MSKIIWEKSNFLIISISTRKTHMIDKYSDVNSSGQFIRAQTKWQRSNMSVLKGDTMSLLDAIRLAVDRGEVY